MSNTPMPWELWKAPDGAWTLRARWTDDAGRTHTAWPAVFNCGAQDNEANARLVYSAINSHDRLQAENKALREALEWHTIETAPKDGAGRGLYGSETRGPEILLSDGRATYIGFWNGHSWDDGDFHSDIDGITHWMPLPASPSALASQQDGGTR